MNKNALVSWSGGKDSCFAAMLAKQQGYELKALLNVLNEEGKISRSHGIPEEILKAQANAANLTIKLISSSWQDYEQHFTAALKTLHKDFDIPLAVFGDIDLQAHKDWEENVCAAAGIQAILPLWQQDRKELVLQMLDAGIETMIVSCNETMGERFLGKVLNRQLIQELEELEIDVCGENGEFHTLVTACPLFEKPIKVSVDEKLKHEQYWFTKLSLV